MIFQAWPRAVAIGGAVALAAGTVAALGAPRALAATGPVQQAFSCEAQTGGQVPAQALTVPAGVSYVTITASGGSGAGGSSWGSASGGAGGNGTSLSGAFPVSAGDVLQVLVGCAGSAGGNYGQGGSGGRVGPDDRQRRQRPGHHLLYARRADDGQGIDL